MFQINNKQNHYDISDYTVIDIIGTGSFGTCYKVKHRVTNKFYVWKAVDYGSMSMNEKELLVTEVNLMSSLKHPNIVQYYGRIIHKSSGTLYIIMEWCQCGDLDSLINNCKLYHRRVNENFVWKVLYQTAKALEACHSLLHQITVLHRDIKPANIFLDENYNVKLGDFGLAKILRNNNNFSSTVVGTPYYMSPEQIRGSKYNKKSDVWSLGCLLYELCCLHQPFNGKNMEELKKNISSNKLSRIPHNYSDDLDRMVKLLLNSNFEFRPSVEMIVHHPTVICNYNDQAVPFHVEKNVRNAPSSPTEIHPPKNEENPLKCKNIGNLVSGIEKLSEKVHYSFEMDPEKISEDVYNEKLISRLQLLRIKENALKAKEDSLKQREHLLKTKENTLIQKQKQIEKREYEIANFQRTRCNMLNKRVYRSETAKSNFSQHKLQDHKKTVLEDDLESTTCSADPGDSSIAPTAVKLDPTKIIKPSFFITNSKRKNVNRKCDENLIGFCVNNERQRQPLAFLQNQSTADVATIHSNPKSTFFLKKCPQFIYNK